MRRIPVFRKMKGIIKIDTYEGELIEDKVEYRDWETKNLSRILHHWFTRRKQTVCYLNIISGLTDGT